jgi:hypothetical protein
MNEVELHDVLADLAGPAEPAPPAARAAVRARVRRARRRTGMAAVTGALVAALAVAGAVDALAARPGGGRAADRPGACARVPDAVPRAEVPPDVTRWAGDRRVIGEGSLWTARSLTRATPVHDGAGWRVKIGWYVRPPGPDASPPSLAARRLDGPGRATGEVGAATDAHGTWFASTITFPRTGCWQVTARHGDDVIRFRRSVGSPTRGAGR